MVERTCAECEVKYEGNPRSKFCGSKCRYRNKDKAKRAPCANCGDLIYPGPGRREDAMCRTCRTQAYAEGRTHGTTNTYNKGCRCNECKAAIARVGREYAQRHKEAHGITPSQKYRPRTTPANCTECGGQVRQAFVPQPVCKTCRQSRRRFLPVTETERVAIYERDQWVCQLCDTAVDPSLPYTDKWSATLDHIECQSWALIPDHTARNLRLAHRSCNSRRGNKADA